MSKSYQVEMTYTTTQIIFVEAQSQEDAKRLAHEEVCKDKEWLEGGDWQATNVEGGK